MSKYIIREVEPECADLSYYFDDDGLTEAGGDYCYNLFILNHERFGRVSGFNTDEYENIQRQARDVIDDFAALRGEGWYAPQFRSFKECMEYYGIAYTPTRCHALKEWTENADESEPEDIAAFLTIKTGKTWNLTGVHGYCQGDYVEIVYCPEHYKDGVEHYGEVWLGCAKEFGVIELEDDGAEGDSCWGYIVADCMASTDEDYKRIVCDEAGIDESDATMELFDGYNRTAKYHIA